MLRIWPGTLAARVITGRPGCGLRQM